ncbi:MAG TPA: MerR family transcriptional regulator [Candidatus Eisenbacteria bacterium]|nr:MerR family transcriptional regulator [Candidatus Eisenbacteria bacterium]
MAYGDDQVLFSIGDVAAMVGLSRHTIRAWERRHQLQPRRTASGQRRYTPDDVALLMRVKHAVSRHRLSLKVAFGSAQGELSVPAVQDAASPGLWRTAVDLLPEMFIILDVDGFVEAANQSAAAVLRVPPGELGGRHLADLLERSAPQADIRSLLRYACARRTCFELDLLTVSGPRRWVFDCRPFSSGGEPHLAVIASPSDLGGPAAPCA